MAIKKNSMRQEPILAYLDIGYADPTAYGTAEEAFDLPGNAVLIGGDVVVKTPWNSATTATLKLGDAADDDRYTASAIDLKTAGRTALTLTGYKHAAAEALTRPAPLSSRRRATPLMFSVSIASSTFG